MKNVMVCCSMNGKPDAEHYWEKCKNAVSNYYLNTTQDETIRILDTFVMKDVDWNKIMFLGYSISKGLALADEVVFMDDWEKYNGCRCEHFIAVQYGIPCVYLKS